jgi:hypothetical protein
MRSIMIATVGAMLAASPAPLSQAWAGGLSALDGARIDDPKALDGQRGGTTTTGLDLAEQGNQASVNNTNSGSGVYTGGDASKFNGMISGTNMSGNSGMGTIMANTGDLVNMSNVTNVNVYMK